MQARVDWVLIVFGTQVIKKKRPVRSVFPDYLSVSYDWFQYISIALNLAYSKNKPYKTLQYCVKDMLNFNFSEKGLGLVFPPHYVYDFSRKMLLMLHSIN